MPSVAPVVSSATITANTLFRVSQVVRRAMSTTLVMTSVFQRLAPGLPARATHISTHHGPDESTSYEKRARFFVHKRCLGRPRRSVQRQPGTFSP
jgi:hypothetical protein